MTPQPYTEWPAYGSVVVSTGSPGAPVITGQLGRGYYAVRERSVVGRNLSVLVYRPGDIRPPTEAELATYHLETPST